MRRQAGLVGPSSCVECIGASADSFRGCRPDGTDVCAAARGRSRGRGPAGGVKSGPMSDHAHHIPVLALVAIGVGAALGAWLRWWLGLRLNPLFAHLPLGTLAANLAGGYLIGVAVAFFATRTGLPAELRLFVVTGFLGGLTTFSTFSAEVVHLIETARYAWAAGAAAVHVLGSLAMTALGMWSVHLLRN